MFTPRFPHVFFLAAASLALLAPRVGQTAEGTITFNRDIRPLLSENCFACHGPDSGSREADLRLDDREQAIEAGAITPGEPGDSELISRIMTDDPSIMMPPPDSRKKLTTEQKELLQRWIQEGAAWQQHWSFVRPTKVTLPSSQSDWATNPVDHFILAGLEAVGLQPNEPEQRDRLARRLALDLTGLPPAEELLAEFLADDSQEAYRTYVRSLLESQHAGEHRARYWLDAARYGDTHGMHLDNYREIWPYRDWVIRAFHNNMPFDQFVVEQIAGDLLPSASLDQRIATGFNRCNITTSEGGAIPEELDVRYMVDRVETTATVFLGLTAGCAVCHDHKYDPISQREFYRLGAFFANTTQPAMDGNQKDTPPVLVLPPEEFAEEWQGLQNTRRQLAADQNQGAAAAQRWWVQRDHTAPVRLPDDDLLLTLPLTPEDPSFKLPAGSSWATDHPSQRGVRFGANSEFQVEFPRLKSDQALTISFWFRTPDRLTSTQLFDQTTQITVEPAAEGEAAAKPKKRTVGWQIGSGTSGNLNFSLLDAEGNSVRGLLPDNDALTPRSWQHICVRYSGGQSGASISISMDGRPISLRNAKDDLVEATDLADAPLKIASRLNTAGLSDIRILGRWISDAELMLLAKSDQLAELLKSDRSWEQLDESAQQLATDYYRVAVDAKEQARLTKLAETQTRVDYIYARSTTTLVTEERPSSPRAWVLQRGEYDQRLEEVAPGVPAALPELPAELPTNRLGLAKWMVDPAHPLTARVMVNRLWQSVFGTGLVKSSEDFGVMGDRPSHPDLLDWLAVEFIESGWDVNHMLELMVTSATYQQSATVTAEKLKLDRENRLLSRGPRVRLDAEVLRDQALAVSGLLERTVGGPAVKPYQPSGLWKVVAFAGSNTDTFQPDSGAALYRRSLYTFWKRTSPPPSMAAFNAPTREQCTVRRERTNTPLQALVLLNDTQFVEAARHLAERTLRHSHDDHARAQWMFRRALVQHAEPEELQEMLLALQEFATIFSEDPAAAAELIQTGESKPDDSLAPAELAAWTMVANVLLNRDDFVNK